MERAERNLIFWRSLVGLDSSFPSLVPLRDEELPTHVVLDPNQVAFIHASLAGNQLTQIVVEPGWGRTTLFRYLVKEAQDNAMGRLLLPISIDLEKAFQRSSLTVEALEAEIKLQIIGLLIDAPWEQSLNHNYYFDCINFDSSTDLPTYKARMQLFLTDRPPSPRRLVGQFPWLRGNLGEQLGYLLANLRIQTSLYIHFPRELDSQRIRDLVAAVKVTTEAASVGYAAWREVYFCSNDQRLELGRDFQRPFNVVEYPPYTAAQIYAMLLRRYTPNVPGFRGRTQLQLGSVFDEAFVQRAWRGASSLREVIEVARAEMLRRLDCREQDVPFMLSPLPAETVAERTEPDAPDVAAPKPVFVRRRRTG